MLIEHSRVVLTYEFPPHGLLAGDVGTVVHVYPDGKAPVSSRQFNLGQLGKPLNHVGGVFSDVAF